MDTGVLITIEGPDGAGKSTQIQLMKAFLEERGLTVCVTREPGGTKIGEQIRNIILDKDHQEMDAVTEALLYAASRAQHVAERIQPALDRGEVVLCDRFVDSSIVYQGWGRGLGYEAIRSINDFATQGLEPHATILFDISPEQGLERINVHEKGDRLEQEKIDFHHLVYRGYMEIAKREPKRIKIVKANRSIEEIQRELQDVLIHIVNGRGG